MLEKQRRLLEQSRVWGKVSALFFFLAALAVVDSLQSHILSGKNSIRIVGGHTTQIAGMVPEGIEQVQNIQLPEPKSEKPSTEKIEPRNERESEFWQMLSSDAQYKITALAKEWGVAPNTLRNWKERWNSANLNSQM